MTPVWDDVNARVRGLGNHLLTRSQLEGLAREPDLTSLAAALRSHRMLPGIAAESPAADQLELGLRRWSAELLLVLARWAGDRAEALPLVFDDEDRRSLRAILRGALQHAPAAQRMGGLVPTPSLPERALQELAAAATVPAAIHLLSAWRHPLSAELEPVLAGVEPDAFAIDIALARAAARRSLEAAARSHDRGVRRFVREGIDIDNALSALVAAGAEHDIPTRELFLHGGDRIPIGVFDAAVAPGTRAGAASVVAAAMRDTPYGAALKIAGVDPGATEDALFRSRVEHLAQRVRRNPLTALVPIWFGLRLRAQMTDLQRIVWTVALNGPRRWLVDAWLTAA